MSKAIDILKRHLGESFGYLELDHSEIFLPHLEAAMKEIASLAFDDGSNSGWGFGYYNNYDLAIEAKQKEEFISKLFGE